MQKDHLEILLEDLRSKFDLVIEGHESLNKKIDNNFAELNQKIEHQTFLLGALNRKVDAVAGDLSTHRKEYRGAWEGLEGEGGRGLICGFKWEPSRRPSLYCYGKISPPGARVIGTALR